MLCSEASLDAVAQQAIAEMSAMPRAPAQAQPAPQAFTAGEQQRAMTPMAAAGQQAGNLRNGLHPPAAPELGLHLSSSYTGSEHELQLQVHPLSSGPLHVWRIALLCLLLC